MHKKIISVLCTFVVMANKLILSLVCIAQVIFFFFVFFFWRIVTPRSTRTKCVYLNMEKMFVLELFFHSFWKSRDKMSFFFEYFNCILWLHLCTNLIKKRDGFCSTVRRYFYWINRVAENPEILGWFTLIRSQRRFVHEIILLNKNFLILFKTFFSICVFSFL